MLQTRKLAAVVLTFSVSMLISTATLASGGYNDNSYSKPAKPKKVDTVYELGKSTYNGRINGVAVKYCILKGDESARVKRTTIKQLKNTSYTVLGTSLHNCVKPEQSMASLLDENQLNAVAYYLDKRYQLNLSKS